MVFNNTKVAKIRFSLKAVKGDIRKRVEIRIRIKAQENRNWHRRPCW
jgi:hypothetical protein